MTRDFWWIVIYGPMTQPRIFRALRFAGERAEPQREVIAMIAGAPRDARR